MATVSRRQFVAAGGGLGLAALLSSCGSPIVSSLTGGQPTTADVIYWNLFGGGDGVNMTTMVADYQRRSGRSVESTLLSWGNPYYTKLAISTASGRPPDVAISHLSRLPLLAEAGLVEPVGSQFTQVGITQDKFTPAAWHKATVGGAVYAVPLDTHPFVLFYNVPLAKKAGLLNAAGDNLKPIHGSAEFMSAIKAMKDASRESYGTVMTVTADPAISWRFFSMVYSGLAGPIVSDQATRVTIDRAALEETFAFMQRLTGKERLMPRTATATTSSSLFSQGKVGFLFDGEWQIPTYRGVKQANGTTLDFNVIRFPALLGPKPVAYADSHSFVIPRNTARSAQGSTDAVDFIKGLLDESAIWAHGGHIPAWLPVQQSKAFLEQKPQSNYIQAAFHAVYDPVAWYTGAGSDFQIAIGSVIANVLSGGTNPKGGARDRTANLKTFSTTRPPVR